MAEEIQDSTFDCRDVRTAKRTATILASSIMAAAAIGDTRSSDETIRAAHTIIAMTLAMKAHPEMGKDRFDELLSATINASISLAQCSENDLHTFNPSGDEPFTIAYKTLAISLADMFPGRIPVPDGMTPDEFYGIVVQNRNAILSKAGLRYSNQ